MVASRLWGWDSGVAVALRTAMPGAHSSGKRRQQDGHVLLGSPVHSAWEPSTSGRMTPLSLAAMLVGSLSTLLVVPSQAKVASPCPSNPIPAQPGHFPHPGTHFPKPSGNSCPYTELGALPTCWLWDNDPRRGVPERNQKSGYHLPPLRAGSPWSWSRGLGQQDIKEERAGCRDRGPAPAGTGNWRSPLPYLSYPSSPLPLHQLQAR